MADHAVEIGPPPAGKSYLDMSAIVEAARTSGADGVHPGYGFLAERADFASAVEDAGLRFVGPKPEHIELMGDKARAREAAEAVGVPTIPGSDGAVDDADEAAAVAGEIGYPVALKAAGGGGGRGIRIVHDEARLRSQYKTAAREAAGSVRRRADLRRALHHRSPPRGGPGARRRGADDPPARARVLPPAAAPEGGRGVARPQARGATRGGLYEAAIALCDEIGYRSAGTVEFLVDAASGEFFFIEMNTRIQVEHPMTELITGIDLIAEQLRIAGGEPLRLRQEDIAPRGCAIELRINAEDPANNFLPSPGHGRRGSLPAGPVGPRRHLAGAGRRGPAVLRLAARQGDRLGRGPRDSALARARRALRRARGGGREDDQAAARRAARRGVVRAGRVPHRDAGELAGRDDEGSAGRMSSADATGARYSWGARRALFVEMAEEMSLEAYFRAMADHQGAARATARRGARDLPGERLLPGALRPGHARARTAARRCCSEIEAEVGDAHDFDVRDAHRRDPGALQRPLDARDADALPRPPPGSRGDGHRVRGADQRLRRRRGLHRRALGLAVVRLDGRVRRRAAVPVPDGARGNGRSRCPSTCARGPTRRS